MAYYANFDKPTEIIKDDWKDFEISSKNGSIKKVTLRDIIQAKSLILKYEKKISELEKLSIQVGEDEYFLDSRFDILDFLIGETHKEFSNYRCVTITKYNEDKVLSGISIQDTVLYQEFEYFREGFHEGEIFSHEILNSFFKSHEKRYGFGAVAKRTLLPMFSKNYFTISINLSEAATSLPYIQPIFDTNFNLYEKSLINPFVFDNGKWKVKGLEEAKRKTFDIKQKIEPSINYDEISKLFDDLVIEINQILTMKDNETKE